MKILALLSGAVLTSLAFASAIAAGDERMAKLQAQADSRFAAADVNHDGQLTQAEAKGHMPRVYSHFDEIDATHKGYVTLDEIKAFGMAKLADHQK